MASFSHSKLSFFYVFLSRMQDIVQSGILTKWRKKWTNVVNHCDLKRAAYASEANPMTILDIQGELFLFAIGVFIAHIVLALEIVWSKIGWCPT